MKRWPSCCRKNAPTARSEKEKSIDAVSEAAIQRIVIASASARTTRGPALSGIPPLDHVQMAAIAPQTSDAITFRRPRMPAGLLTLPLKVDAWLGSRWNAVRGRFLHSALTLLPSLVGAPGGAA